MKTDLAMRGVWTPWAEVLCLKCHGPSFGTYRAPMSPEAFAKACEWVEKEDGTEATVCDKCRGRIWVRSDVAMLNELRYAIGATSWGDDSWGGSEMQQMGGMTCALRVQTKKKGIIAIVTDGETENPRDFMIGLYTEKGWDSGEEETATIGWGIYRGTKAAIATIRAGRPLKGGLRER